MEAQAFAATSEQLSLKSPEYSARWGMNAKQRITGFSLTIGYMVWLWLALDTAVKTAAIAIACMFGVIIAMRIWTVIAADAKAGGALGARQRRGLADSEHSRAPLPRSRRCASVDRGDFAD